MFSAAAKVILVFTMWMDGTPPAAPVYLETSSEAACQQAAIESRALAAYYMSLVKVDVMVMAECISYDDLEEKAI